MMNRHIIVLLASLLFASCGGPEGPQLEMDMTSPASEGNSSSLPWEKCMTHTLNNPESGDLGLQIQNLLNIHSCVNVKLPAKTKWTWNQMVMMKNFQALAISGGGWQNNVPESITTELTLTQNATLDLENAKNRRIPSRIRVGAYGRFTLEGVIINELAADARNLTPVCYDMALFGLGGESGYIEINNSKINTSEHIVAVQQTGTLRLVHSQAANTASSGMLMRDVQLVATDRAWCALGSQVNIFRNNFTATKVALDKADGFLYVPSL